MVKIVFLIFIISFFYIFPVKAQIQNSNLQRDYFDKKYGMDVFLNEGRIFYPEGNIVSGHPYWGQDNFLQGDIILAGKRYNNQSIKYDICNQFFILSFNDLIGAEKQIILNSDIIDTVYLENSIFIKNPISKIDYEFIQLVNNGTIPCFLTWKKEKMVQSATQKLGYSYTKEKSIKYLIYDSVLYKFKNKRDLASIFPKKQREDIRQYMSSNSIVLQKVDIQQLEQLIKHIETLITKR